MAKDEGKKAKAKRKSAKLPKKLAGVKIDKALRKTGDKLIAKAASPQGRRVIAAGLAVAASAAAARSRPHPPRPPRPPEPPTPGTPGTSSPDLDFDQITTAFRTATAAFLDGFFGRRH